MSAASASSPTRPEDGARPLLAVRQLRHELRNYARTRRSHQTTSGRSVALGCFLGALNLARNCELVSDAEQRRWDRRLARVMRAAIAPERQS